MSSQSYTTHLADVVAGETRICTKNEAGPFYRGYALADLAATARFEEVAHLLIYGDLPSRQQLSLFHDTMMEYRRLPLPVKDTMRSIPTDNPMMDVLRTTVSMAGHFDPTEGDGPDALRRRSLWLLATIASLIAARYRLCHREQPLEPKPGLSHAEQLLHQCLGRDADEGAARLVDQMLVLYAEHGFSPSTFAARVIASTGTDLVSAIVGAIGALKGPRHGGAGGKVAEMLGRLGSLAEAEQFIRRALDNGETVPGFGNRVYANGDPRVAVLERELRSLATRRGGEERLAVHDVIKDIMQKERNVGPNIDFAAGLACNLLELPADLCTPLFVAGRVAGWCAHCIEQWETPGTYRPVGTYVGELPRPVPPIEAR